jgi:hypothetical protein
MLIPVWNFGRLFGFSHPVARSNHLKWHPCLESRIRQNCSRVIHHRFLGHPEGNDFILVFLKPPLALPRPLRALRTRQQLVDVLNWKTRFHYLNPFGGHSLQRNRKSSKSSKKRVIVMPSLVDCWRKNVSLRFSSLISIGLPLVGLGPFRCFFPIPVTGGFSLCCFAMHSVIYTYIYSCKKN